MNPGRIIAGVAMAYFVFDFLLWNGGLVNPSVVSRILSVGMIAPF